MHWQANGHDYGLPASTDVSFAAGRVVVANLSRAVVVQASKRYGRLAAVHVTAPAPVLAARRAERGRETAGEMDKRLRRAPGLGVDPERVFQIDNCGPIEVGTGRLTGLLTALADRPVFKPWRVGAGGKPVPARPRPAQPCGQTSDCPRLFM